MKIYIISRQDNLITYGVYTEALQPVGVIEKTPDSINIYPLTYSTSKEALKAAYNNYMTL